MTGTAFRFPRTVAMQIAAVLFLAGAGMALAAEEPQLARACEGCHGPGGRSANPQVPSLAAQPRQFIATQLLMYREGNRKNPVMSPLTSQLTNADINQLAAFFSVQAPATPVAALPPERAGAGRLLTQQYFCVNCHGPAVHGQMHIPRLAGQQAEYLRVQLRGFRAMTRFDMDGQMSSAVQALTPADIDLLADYLSTLP